MPKNTVDLGALFNGQKLNTNATKHIKHTNDTIVKSIRLPETTCAKCEHYLALENLRRQGLHRTLKKAAIMTEEDVKDEGIRISFNSLIYIALEEYLEHHMDGDIIK